MSRLCALGDEIGSSNHGPNTFRSSQRQGVEKSCHEDGKTIWQRCNFFHSATSTEEPAAWNDVKMPFCFIQLHPRAMTSKAL
jgi:hypothetical protein